MADRARIAFLAAVIAVAVGLAGLTYVWLSTPRLTGGNPPGNEAVTLETVRTGLRYPIALAFAPDGRVFYAERMTGNIQILGSPTTGPTTFYTLTGTDSSGERGLLGLALDPDFPTLPYLYAYQTYNDASNGTLYNRIVRIRADGDVGVSPSVLLALPPPTGAMNHNGGVIAFGPDGKLYAVVGEQAIQERSQDPLSPLGKVLRMNPDGSTPPDNPFAGNPNWHPLVYTYGHRNMFGLAFSPVTDEAYVTENGPGDSDEVNRLIPGGNYGWPTVRGIVNTPPFIDPIVAYFDIIVPTNAAFYTADVPAASRNHLVFGTYSDRQLRDLALDPSDGGRVLAQTVLATAPDPIIDVEMGLDGYLWITTPNAIYRLVPTPQRMLPFPASPAFALSIAAGAPANLGRAVPWIRKIRPPVDRVADHPGSLSREGGVLAARCRRTGSRATIGWSNRSDGS